MLQMEAQALVALADRTGAELAEACSLVLACSGRVVVTGMGKSGHIGGKIAATLASTGTPAFFVHPGEASHGDLGMITREDVVIAISYSGANPEINTLLPLFKRFGIPVIALTGDKTSPLAKASDVTLDIGVTLEACPHNLAPTTSTTATLAMGDALAVALLESRGFTREDFARSHPGGALGKRLLLSVRDLMRAGDNLPVVQPGTPLTAALDEMSSKRLGITTVVDEQNQLLGVFTDGDLRRAVSNGVDLGAALIDDVMTPGGIRVSADDLAAEAARLFETHPVTVLLVVSTTGELQGTLEIYDLVQAGIL